ncbi:MAG: hypothetical protein FWF41_06490 [Betaproteobacteria bacterium]|nr:hypothetical protein [Betaproteobacteria bacterium]
MANKLLTSDESFQGVVVCSGGGGSQHSFVSQCLQRQVLFSEVLQMSVFKTLEL